MFILNTTCPKLPYICCRHTAVGGGGGCLWSSITVDNLCMKGTSVSVCFSHGLLLWWGRNGRDLFSICISRIEATMYTYCTCSHMSWTQIWLSLIVQSFYTKWKWMSVEQWPWTRHLVYSLRARLGCFPTDISKTGLCWSQRRLRR